MKTLVKLININDDREKEHYNGDWLHIVSRPRAEKIIAAFLNDGWKLEGSGRKYDPSINKPGVYSFYDGGWELLFTKAVEDDAEDNGDELIFNILSELGYGETDEDAEDEEDDDEDDDDEDEDEDEDAAEEDDEDIVYEYIDDELLNYDDN